MSDEQLCEHVLPPTIDDYRYVSDAKVVQRWLADRGLIAIERALAEAALNKFRTADGYCAVYYGDQDIYRLKHRPG
jgi:hypothetical protein